LSRGYFLRNTDHHFTVLFVFRAEPLSLSVLVDQFTANNYITLFCQYYIILHGKNRVIKVFKNLARFENNFVWALKIIT